MRKLTVWICTLLFFCMISGCGAKKQEFEAPVNFYYCRKEISYNTSTGVLQPEIREGSSFHSNLTACLRAYMLGPTSSDLHRVIPAEVYLVSCELQENTALVVMSNQFSQLSGVDLWTACSALMLTVNDFADVEHLTIQVKDALPEAASEFTISMDDIVLIDTMNE